MSEIRVWYSSRDAYHCAFRMMRILTLAGEAMPIERLRILDLYLLFPSLLERASLPMPIKTRFRALKLPPIAKMFVRLPGTAAVWQDLQIYQAAALKQLAGRDLLKRDCLRDQYAALSTANVPEEMDMRIRKTNADDMELMTFLVGGIGSLPLHGADNIFRRAGLPARGPLL